VAGALHTEAYQRLLKALILHRNKQNLSQAELADRLGKPHSFVGKYELGERRLDVVEVFVILNAQGLEPLAFLEEVLTELPHKLK